mgnify:CR=1 FL=1
MAVGRPSVLAVTGAQEFLRRRYLKGVQRSFLEQGYKLDYADGSDKSELLTALYGTTDLFLDDDRKTVVFVSNPEKADINLIKGHSEKKDQDVVLVLDHPGEPRGNTRFGIFVKSLGKAHANFPEPPFWEAERVAASFCMNEADSYGKTLTLDKASALVQRVGTDLGFLAFEIQKMCILADVDGSDEITVDHINDGMAPLLQASVNPLMEALAMRDRKGIMRSLERIRLTAKDDPTIQITRLLWVSVSKWLAASDLVEKNVPPDDAASRMGIKPWLYVNKVLPQVRRWPRKDVAKLVRVLAGAERAVFNGGIKPWAVLTTGLIGVCGGPR